MFGFELIHLDAGYFVTEVVAGAPAEVAGVRRGDRLLSADGSAPDDATLRPLPWDVGLGGPRGYYPAATKGRTVAFELERRPRSSREGWNRYKVELTPMPWNEIEASRASARVATLGPGVPIGYVRVYHLLSEDTIDIVAELLSKGALKDAEALVLDVRGKGGLTSAVDRLCTIFDKGARGGPIWGRPSVLVVDGSTRSAKEILTWRWRDMKAGPIVGTKTCGAVIGAQFKPLPDGAWLILANFDMRCLTGGNSLEARGVEPDVLVADSLPYAEGRDPCVDAAFDKALETALARRRRGKTHGWY